MSFLQSLILYAIEILFPYLKGLSISALQALAKADPSLAPYINELIAILNGGTSLSKSMQLVAHFKKFQFQATK